MMARIELIIAVAPSVYPQVAQGIFVQGKARVLNQKCINCSTYFTLLLAQGESG
jgi:hypothetical protein